MSDSTPSNNDGTGETPMQARMKRLNEVAGEIEQSFKKMKQSMNERDELIKSFEDYLTSDVLSLDKVQDIVNSIPTKFKHKAQYFLHSACMNKTVTLEIVDFLLEAYPIAGRIVRDTEKGDGVMSQHGRAATLKRISSSIA